MTQTHLSALTDAGVSIWLDDLSRDRLTSGSLAEDLTAKRISGITSNPTIFAAAVSGSSQYDDQIADLAARGVSVDEAVHMITTADVRSACDVLAPVYEETGGVDGRVSIEVDPRFARHETATIAEARQLWWLVDRPNAMIKIPATLEGLPAIRAALAEGISVNVTLIFSLDRYRAVVDAFLAGLEDARMNGHDLSTIASVASFFISRVDSEVDKRLAGLDEGRVLRGRAAIANARLAYEHHERVIASDRWKSLEASGARPQRPLWASTSTKDPSYPDTMYVTDLVAAGTVNTMPQATLDAFAEHGPVPEDAAGWDTVTPTYVEAREVLTGLGEAGIDMDDVTRQLEDEGVQKFIDSWEELLGKVAAQMGK